MRKRSDFYEKEEIKNRKKNIFLFVLVPLEVPQDLLELGFQIIVSFLEWVLGSKHSSVTERKHS